MTPIGMKLHCPVAVTHPKSVESLNVNYCNCKLPRPPNSSSFRPNRCTHLIIFNFSPLPMRKFGMGLHSNRDPHRIQASKNDHRCSDTSWKWASQILLIGFSWLSLAVNAVVYQNPFTYTCEDVKSYYASVDHLKGEALKKMLNSIVATHHALSYEEVWEALKILDAADIDKPDASPEIVEIYSLRAVPKRLAGKPEGWNREHLWPRSYGLRNGPSLTDLHNIRPADINVNSSRGNKYFGECNVKSNKCFKPANKEASMDTETDRERWAPPLQVRGDIARAVMYMAVCYGFHGPRGGPDLDLSDSPSMVKREMGLLSTLLKWNELDPPSTEERLRNERVCKFYQQNRNPFVDHPEYANLIWKQTTTNTQS